MRPQIIDIAWRVGALLFASHLPIFKTVCIMSQNEPSRVIDKNLRKIAQLYSVFDGDYDAELFAKQLSVDDFEIDYKIPPSHTYDESLAGSTILHAVGYDNTLFGQSLIDHGADFTETNKKGSTVLHKEIRSEYDTYLHRSKCFNYKEKSRADFVLSAHIESRNTKNPRNKNGLSHFHMACMFNHADGAEFFLKNGVSINETVNKDSTFYPGYSALHFAIKSCAVDVVELLLKSGADIFLENLEGMNSLNLLIVERIKIFIRLKRVSRIEPLDTNKHHSNLINYYGETKNMLNLFIDRIDQCGNHFPANATFLLVHLICSAENAKIKQFIDCNKEIFAELVNTGSQALNGRTPAHIAAYFSIETLELLIQNGASLTTKDANNMTPFDIYLTGSNVVDVHRIIWRHPDYSEIVFSNGKTKLSDFIYAMRDVATFEIFLKNHLTYANMFIPFDSPVCAGYTPLHLVVMCTEQPLNWSWKNEVPAVDLFANFKSEESQKYLSKIDLCLHYNPDVTSRDARGSTPLHWAFRLQESYAVHRLLQRLETSSNYVDEYGLSHLHIACAMKHEALIGKLIHGGADINQVATSGYTWLDFNYTGIYSVLNGGKHFIHKGSTPLHFAVSVPCPRIVEILLMYKANVLAKDADGFNPLERLLDKSIFADEKALVEKKLYVFEKEELQIAELLMRKITSTLVDSEPDQLMYCYSLLNDELVANICKYYDESLLKLFASWGITPLHVACFVKDLSRICNFVTEYDVNARVDLKSPLWPGCTPMYLFTCYSWSDQLNSPTSRTIVEILLQRGANVTAVNAEGETPLHRAFEFSRIRPHLNTMLEHMQDFSINPIGKTRFSHLHIASFAGKTTIVEKLLEHGAEIDRPAHFFIRNRRDVAHAGYTALHFAVAYRRKEVVDVLLKHGADVNWRNAYNENVLHVASKYRRPSLEMLQTLLSAGADIRARNKYGNTPFESLMKSSDFTKREFDFFLENDRQCINTVNPITDEAFLAIALNKSKELPIFEIVVKEPSVKIFDHNGRNAIHNIVSFRRPSWSHFYQNTIDEKYTPSADYTRAIGSLIKLGLNIDHQDCRGLTPLHVAAQMQNITGIIGLLENGADINITDTDGKTAFAYSLELAKPYNDLMDLDSRIFKVVSTYIFKLNLARIGVGNLNREIENRIREIHSFEVPRVEEITNEIDKMTSEYINSESVTFHDFLSDTGAVSAYPYMLPPKRKAIDYVFKNEVESLRAKFPEFAGILLLQYRKALSRHDKLHPASTSLDFLVGFDMPAVCSKIILEFLSNDELDSLNFSDNID